MENNVYDLLTKLEKMYFFSNINEKEKPPISPVPTETRELARRAFEDFMKKVEKAKEKSKETGEVIDIEGNRLSGVKSGDIWKVNKDGIVDRVFEPNEGLLEGLLQRRTERVADPEKDVDFELLLKILSYAQWAPNATNEQPTKILIYKKDHPSMEKIGILMKMALEEKIVPEITIRNYIINKKKENPNFLPDLSLLDLMEMDDEKFNSYHFEEMPAPLHELPQTTAKLLERGKIVFENGKYYNRNSDGTKGDEYKLKDLLVNDIIFTKGMGKFFLKFKNTHPYLIVILRKWHYTSLMTETLYKYGVQLPDVGEEFIDAGFYSDYLALATRGFGLSGVVKTGPLDLAKDELTELFINDLKEKLDLYEKLLSDDKNLIDEYKKIIMKEIEKIKVIYNGLKYGLEAMRCKEQNRPMREQLLVALKRGEVYVPATFFQLGYPLPCPEERIRDPRQGRDPIDNMMILM